MSRRSERKDEERPRRGGRPRGEERVAIAAAARDLQAERRVSPLQSAEGTPLVGATGIELMHRARVGRHVSSRVLKDMVRSGEMVKVGKVQIPGAPRLLTVYALPMAPAAAPAFGDKTAAIAAVMKEWTQVPQLSPT